MDVFHLSYPGNGLEESDDWTSVRRGIILLQIEEGGKEQKETESSLPHSGRGEERGEKALHVVEVCRPLY